MKGNITITRMGPVVKITNKAGGHAKSGKDKSGKVAASAHRKKGKRRKAVSQSRAISRSVNEFCQRVRATRNGPKYHISVNIPRVHTKFGLLALEYSLGEFFKEVQRRYPKMYFYRLYDFSIEAGLHAHLIGRFHAGKKLRELEPELRAIWLDTVGVDKPSLLKVERYTEATLGYLTSPDKYNDRLITRNILGGKRLWAVFNRKYAKKQKEQKFSFTAEEYSMFRMILVELIRDAELPKSNIQQLEKANTCLNYLPAELLDRAFQEFSEWRTRNDL